MKDEMGEKQKKHIKLWDQLFRKKAVVTQNNYDVVMNYFLIVFHSITPKILHALLKFQGDD